MSCVIIWHYITTKGQLKHIHCILKYIHIHIEFSDCVPVIWPWPEFLLSIKARSENITTYKSITIWNNITFFLFSHPCSCHKWYEILIQKKILRMLLFLKTELPFYRLVICFKLNVCMICLKQLHEYEKYTFYLKN